MQAAFGVCRQLKIDLYPTVIFGRASQFLAAMAANSSSAGDNATGLHTAAAENRKKAKEIVQDILDYFELPHVDIPEFPTAEHPQPPAHAHANVTAPTLPVLSGNGSAGAGGGAPQLQGGDGQRGNAVAGALNAAAQIAAPLVATGGQQAARADPRDMAAATLQTFHEMVETDGKLASQREAFLAFWTLASGTHPVPACRAGATALLAALPDWWPKGAGEAWRPPEAMQEHQICGPEVHNEHGVEQPFFTCTGSQEGTRGYTCGMWMLLHSMAVGRAPAMWTSLGFVHSLCCLHIALWQVTRLADAACLTSALSLRGQLQFVRLGTHAGVGVQAGRRGCRALAAGSTRLRRGVLQVRGVPRPLPAGPRWPAGRQPGREPARRHPLAVAHAQRRQQQACNGALLR